MSYVPFLILHEELSGEICGNKFALTKKKKKKKHNNFKSTVGHTKNSLRKKAISSTNIFLSSSARKL